MKKLLKALGIILTVILAILLICFVANKINEAVMNAYIDTFGAVEFEDQLTPKVDEVGNYYFTTDKEFRVMQITDVHICGGFIYSGNDKKAISAVAAMISEEKPDLVVVTGDISYAVPWSGTLNNKYAHSYFARLMENLGVYWTVTFGNHDAENYGLYDRAEVADMYSDQSLKRCLFSAGPKDVFGESNHVINVRNSKGLITESLIMIDSNAYTEDDVLGIMWDYDNIHDDQIDWYRSVVEYYNAYNVDTYNALPDEEKPADFDLSRVKSLMFMHIPIKEVKYAYDEYVNNNRQNTENLTYLGGHDGESDRVVYSSDKDEELFETILELGSTEALFYGHDHLNNFVFDYKGVILSYGYSIDYSAYSGISGKGYQRGCTVITLKEGEETKIVHENYYQDKYEPLYEKESVNMEK